VENVVLLAVLITLVVKIPNTQREYQFIISQVRKKNQKDIPNGCDLSANIGMNGSLRRHPYYVGAISRILVSNKIEKLQLLLV
jgi:hypothetical protein